MSVIIAYHVTRHIKAVLKSGVVKPSRMESVYLLKSWRDANNYAHTFGGNGVVKVRIESKQILSRWKSTYAKHGCIKLKAGEICKVLGQLTLKPQLNRVARPKDFFIGSGIVFKTVCVPISYDGRKAGGNNPRGRQVLIKPTKKSGGCYMVLDEVEKLAEYLKKADSWIKERKN